MVPNNAVETLWVLARITLVVVFNMILSTARSHVVDSASKRVDAPVGADHGARAGSAHGGPVSVGSFAANLRSFESIRDFIASATITTLVDLFILLFLLALVWISPWMVLPPLVAIVLILLVSLAAQARMEALTMASFQASSQRNATLVEALTGLEAVKTLNAQGAIQRNWERATEFIAQTGKLKLISSSTVGFVAAVQQLVSISVVVIGVYQAQESAISMGGIIAASMIAGRCLAPLGQVAGLLMQYQNARTSLASIDNYMKLPIERPPRPSSCTARSSMARWNSRRHLRLPRQLAAGAEEGVVQDRRAKRSASSAASARARPRWKSWPWRCTSSPRAPCCWTAWTCARSIRPTCAAPSATCRRIRCCSTAASQPGHGRALCGRRQHPGRGQPGRRVRVRQPASQRLRHADRRARRVPVRRPAPVGGRGPRADQRPPILLLDEPSSNMDHQSEAQLRKRLGEVSASKTIMLVTHRTALLELVDRLIVIDNGQIMADGPKEQVIEALRQGRVGRGS